MKTMSPEQKEAFQAKIKHHKEEEAEHKGVLWIESKKGHDCDFDPNSKSPLAGCRSKNPPKDNYQPYVGAATVEKTTEDDREKTKSWERNVLKEYQEEEARLRKIKEENEKKEDDLKMEKMNA